MGAATFAVGVILYEMLTRKRAFQMSTAAETMTEILKEDPPSLVQAAQTLLPPLQKIVSRCLEKKPEQRFQHASDLGFAPKTLPDSSGIAIPVVRQEASSRRWTWIGAGIAGAAIAATLVGNPTAIRENNP